MSLRLRIEHGQDAGKTWRLSEPGVYTLGRTMSVSMRVLDMKVSKVHCEVHVKSAEGGDQAMLHDLGSTHGCQLNGQPVKKDLPLNAGDELRLGLTILRVLSDGNADEEAKPVAGRGVDEARIAEVGRPNASDGKTRQTLPPDELVGKELGGYTIENKVGAGGMGGVYLAEQTSLRRKVALKVLNEKFASDSAFVDQFVNEARAAGALNHPNVVQVYDVGSAGDRYFFSMELMPGGSIEDRIRAGDVEWSEGLNWFIDASNALIFARKRGILHRDVKPDNLMLAEDQSAKLCDLGLAKKSEVGDLMAQGIIGTPHFISPEAVRRKTDIDHRTDLYSLGCSFYRVFTGQNPYPGTTVKEILLGHLNKPVPHINAINRDVPNELDDVVAKLMAKDPEERYQTPEELLRILDKIRTQYNLEAHGIKPASRKPLVIGGVAALIAIGIAVWFATRPPPPPVVKPMSAEQKQMLLETNRRDVLTTLQQFVLTADKRLVELRGQIQSGNLKRGENWKLPLWPRISGELRGAADAWEEETQAWGTAAADEKDDVIRGYYRDESAKLTTLVEEARQEAKDIDDEVKYRKDNEKRFEEGRKAALAEAQATIKAYGERVRAHFDQKQFLDLERALDPMAIRAIIDPLLARKVGRLPLLDADEDLKKLLNEHLPGDDKGHNRGKKWVDEAVRTIERSVSAKLNEATQALGSSPDLADYERTITLLKDYLATLPEAADDKAPRTSAAYTRARSVSLQPAIDKFEEDQRALRFAQWAQDKQAFFKFLKRLWAPASEGGLLQAFKLKAAHDQVQVTAGILKSREYRALMGRWVAASEALQAVFTHVASAYPDGWSSESYGYDQRGKRKKGKIRAVTATGLDLGREETTFASLGPTWLLDEYFFFEGEARVTYTPQDLHGLALLAELSGDYKRAFQLYKKAEMAYGADEAVAAVRARMGDLALEQQAAEKWFAVSRWLVEKDAWAKKYEALLGTDAFDEGEVRGQLLSEAKDLKKTGQTMMTMRYELEEDPKLARTAWGSGLRESVHPKVAYAGEPLPDAKPVRAPKPPGNGGAPKPPGNGGDK